MMQIMTVDTLQSEYQSYHFEHPRQFWGVQKVFTFLIECICIKMLKVLDTAFGTSKILLCGMKSLRGEILTADG